MESVREQQERLAKLHFELNSQQDSPTHDTEEGRRLAKENMSKLIDNVSFNFVFEKKIIFTNLNYHLIHKQLQKLSDSIEQLQSNNTTNLQSKFNNKN